VDNTKADFHLLSVAKKWIEKKNKEETCLFILLPRSCWIYRSGGERKNENDQQKVREKGRL